MSKPKRKHSIAGRDLAKEWAELMKPESPIEQQLMEIEWWGDAYCYGTVCAGGKDGIRYRNAGEFRELLDRGVVTNDNLRVGVL